MMGLIGMSIGSKEEHEHYLDRLCDLSSIRCTLYSGVQFPSRLKQGIIFLPFWLLLNLIEAYLNHRPIMSLGSPKRNDEMGV